MMTVVLPSPNSSTTAAAGKTTTTTTTTTTSGAAGRPPPTDGNNRRDVVVFNPYVKVVERPRPANAAAATMMDPCRKFANESRAIALEHHRRHAARPHRTRRTRTVVAGGCDATTSTTTERPVTALEVQRVKDDEYDAKMTAKTTMKTTKTTTTMV